MLLRLRFLVALAAVLLIADRVNAQVPPRFDAYVEKALEEWGVPGAAVAIVKDDKVVLAKGYGRKRVGSPERVDANTIFGIASNTKAFAAASLAILVDEGKLRWNDRVIDHLPKLRMHDPWVTRELRIRDLLSHRNGLSDYGGDIMTWGSSYSREEILERIRHVEPVSSFRSQYAYQNGMFIAAGEVVEAVTGKSWDAFVNERFFVPLGMTSTNTSVTAIAPNANVATPHIYVEGRHEPIPWRNIDNLGAAAAINSSVTDMAQWLRLQLNEGSYAGRRVFSEEASHEMWMPQTLQRVRPRSKQLPPVTNWSAYGLGWSLRQYNGRRMISHGGWTDGMLSAVAMLPEEELGVVVLTNSHNRAITWPLIYRIFDHYTGAKAHDWSATFLARRKEADARAAAATLAREAKRVKGTSPTLPLERYAGTYSNEVYGDVVVTYAGGKLLIDFTASPTFKGELQHWHYDTFESRWRERIPDSAPVVFTITESGSVRDLTTTLGDFIEPKEYTFVRKE